MRSRNRAGRKRAAFEQISIIRYYKKSQQEAYLDLEWLVYSDISTGITSELQKQDLIIKARNIPNRIEKKN